MTIQIDQNLCDGCGICADNCTSGAILLREQRAMIDQALCKQCKACIESCPNMAIKEITQTVDQASALAIPEAKLQMKPIQSQVIISEPTRSTSSLTQLANVALSYLGVEVFPRLIDSMITGLERRLAQPATPCTPEFPRKIKGEPYQRRGKGKRTRNRRRCNEITNQKKRR